MKRKYIVSTVIFLVCILAIFFLHEKSATVVPEKIKPQEKKVYIFSTIPLGNSVPIASITKLMTALVVVEKHPELLAKDILVSETAAKTAGDHAKLSAGERLTGSMLLRAMLIGSSNDAAALFAEQGGTVDFVREMNTLAQTIGMRQTHFGNPTGLDQGLINVSSPQDLSLLLHYLVEQQPDILAITKIQSASITNTAGHVLFTVMTTDDMLSDPYVGSHVIGGKTGETPLSKQNLILLAESKDAGEEPVVFVVLGSTDRLHDMEKLMDEYYGVQRP